MLFLDSEWNQFVSISCHLQMFKIVLRFLPLKDKSEDTGKQN